MIENILKKEEVKQMMLVGLSNITLHPIVRAPTRFSYIERWVYSEDVYTEYMGFLSSVKNRIKVTFWS